MKSESNGLFYKTLENHPRVLCYDNEGTDDGYFMLTLVRGFAFDDAAKTTADDPEAKMALHSKTFPSVKEAVQQLKWAAPCLCGRCMGTF